MQRTTIMLPRDLKLRAKELAHERGVSLASLIRECLRSRLEQAEQEADPLLSDTAVFDTSAPSGLAAEHDNYLYGNDA